jgi:hypothetical protein
MEAARVGIKRPTVTLLAVRGGNGVILGFSGKAGFSPTCQMRKPWMAERRSDDRAVA